MEKQQVSKRNKMKTNKNKTQKAACTVKYQVMLVTLNTDTYLFLRPHDSNILFQLVYQCISL